MNHNIDILKYAMSLFIIMIHAEFCLDAPILRISVPVFFVISSFLFFSKISKLSKEESREAFVKFFKRACKLYIFWTIVLIPYCLALNYHLGELRNYLVYFPIDFLLFGTFPAGWYFPAYIICISLLYYCRKNNWILLILGLALYSLCCLLSNYGNYFYGLPFVEDLFSHASPVMKHYLRILPFCFPAGLIFCLYGKLIAENKRIPVKFSIAGVIIGLILLYFEAAFVVRHDLRVMDDCYFSLLLLVPCLFSLVLECRQITQRDTSTLRKMSTIYYCTHIPFIMLLLFGFKALGIERNNAIIFLLTVVYCTVVSNIILLLVRKPGWRILKYSY